jgi:hypothetical protein
LRHGLRLVNGTVNVVTSVRLRLQLEVTHTPTNDPDYQRLLACPVERDTQMFVQQFHRFGKIPVLLELWKWEGIIGQSAVFLSGDVEQWTDERLIALVAEGVHADLEPVTVRRFPDFTFVNYGFDV